MATPQRASGAHHTVQRVMLRNRIIRVLPELELALRCARDAMTISRTPERDDFNAVVQDLEKAKEVLTAPPSAGQDETSIISVALTDIDRACRLSMHNTLAARIPESGEFGGVAQSLDWVRNMLSDNPWGNLAH